MRVSVWLRDENIYIVKQDTPASDPDGDGYYEIAEETLSNESVVSDILHIYAGNADDDLTECFTDEGLDTDDDILLVEYDGHELTFQAQAIIDEVQDTEMLDYLGFPDDL